ncbi:nitric oxide reductase F protein [Celeribacter sp.]|uniref:nitric oxide reductase F protein n=1 Tax=Celeribacter sp. TaxID=1890673 RepID=UPI003A8F1460
MKRLIYAWGIVVVASVLTTLLAVMHGSAIWIAPALMGLALIKSRVILAQYLDLYQAPRMLAGMTTVVVFWAAVALVLIMAAP